MGQISSQANWAITIYDILFFLVQKPAELDENKHGHKSIGMWTNCHLYQDVYIYSLGKSFASSHLLSHVFFSFSFCRVAYSETNLGKCIALWAIAWNHMASRHRTGHCLDCWWFAANHWQWMEQFHHWYDLILSFLIYFNTVFVDKKKKYALDFMTGDNQKQVKLATVATVSAGREELVKL